MMRPFRSMMNRIEDLLIWRSFDQRGFLRHQREWVGAGIPSDLSRCRYMISGANRGIGFSIAEGLAERGAQLELICRSRIRGDQAAERLRQRGATSVSLIEADLSQTKSLAEQLKAHSAIDAPPLNALIHNAGLMPRERMLNEAGEEQTYAVHLLSPLELTLRLRDRLRAAQGRVIFHSSGGAYSQRLRLGWLREGARGDRGYDGLIAYAQSKRAQIDLARALHAQFSPELSVFSCHPGWVATEGLAEAMPRFTAWAGDRLRPSPAGADCALWLAAATLDGTTLQRGGFYFDRRRVSEHLSPWTWRGENTRQMLVQLCLESLGRSSID